MKTKKYLPCLLILGLTCRQIHSMQKVDDLGCQLATSILHGKNDKAKELILTGADVNYRFNKILTPLMLAAACCQDVELIQMLVDNGAAAHIGTWLGSFTALHYLAAADGFPIEDFKTIVNILLRAKADINARDQKGDTPLHYASEKGLADKVSYLLSCGADPGIKNNAGKLPVDFINEENKSLRVLFATRSQNLLKND